MCAIKIIKKKGLRGDQVMQELMEGELQTLEETSHPNIVRIYELLHDDRHYYIVSEYIRGGELYSLIVKR